MESESADAHHTEESRTAAASEPRNVSSRPAVLAASTALVSANAGDGLQRAASGVVRRLGGVTLSMLWLCTTMGASWFGWRVLDGYLARRRTATIIVRHFVQRFVEEFERPLVRDEAGGRCVRSRLRLGVRRDRFKLLLAPGEGKRYPNLSDHRKNVEYDVARVTQALADDAFVSGGLYAEAEWIVVPFQFTAGPRQSGAPCNFSL